MSETQLLSDILNDSPCTELLRLRNRKHFISTENLWRMTR